jgi:RNA polymerase sigma-70 factor (sigma-E family)
MKFLHRRTATEDEDFAEFVREVSPRLLRTAFLLGGGQDAAEDLVQEALERACRRWRRIAATEAPEAYVHRIVVNLANDRWRHTSRLRESERALAAERSDPRDEYGRLELRDQLTALLETLPIRMRTVIVLRYFHDMDDAQIADVLAISTSTVRSQLSRGLAKLRATAGADEAHETDPGDRARTEAPVAALIPATRLPLGGAR